MKYICRYYSRLLDHTEWDRYFSIDFYHFTADYKASKIAQYPLPLGKYIQDILVLIYALVFKPIQFSMLQEERMYRPFEG